MRSSTIHMEVIEGHAGILIFFKKYIYVGPFCKEGDGCVLYTFGFRAFAGEFLFYRIRKRITHLCIKIEERVFTTR